MKVETTDLYLSAYLMAKGITLNSMSIHETGDRKKIVFIFTGNADLNRLNKSFQRGVAKVNPISMKESILHLKDIMYDKLRSNKGEKRRNENKQKGN